MLKVIGDGLIGNAIKKNIIYSDCAFFASGVSNSNEKNEKNFKREVDTFEKFSNEVGSESRIVYFSTYSIFDTFPKNFEYKKHKINMENMVKKLDKYVIIRLPNIVGNGGNPNTMFNYFLNSFNNNNEITILENAHRNFLDIDDLVCFLKNLDSNSPNIIDLIHPVTYKVSDIVTLLSSFLKKNVLIKKTSGGVNYFQETDKYVLNILKKCDVDLSENYLSKIIKKYI